MRSGSDGGLKLTAWRRDDQCHYIVYGRGAFSTAHDDESWCNYFTETAQPFDAQATTDFDEVSSALDAAGIDVELVRDIEYRRDGTFQWVTFDFGGAPFVEQSYVYSQGGVFDPDVGATYTPINGDWYMLVD